MDSIVHIENDKFAGRTNFKSGLLNSVVELSIKEVAGVAKLAPTFGTVMQKLFQPNTRQGVKVTYDNNALIIDVCIWIEYGYSAADVSYRVQENVMSAASAIIDKKVKAVNVHITNANVPYWNENLARS